jgi:hypothetical protein
MYACMKGALRESATRRSSRRATSSSEEFRDEVGDGRVWTARFI